MTAVYSTLADSMTNSCDGGSIERNSRVAIAVKNCREGCVFTRPKEDVLTSQESKCCGTAGFIGSATAEDITVCNVMNDVPELTVFNQTDTTICPSEQTIPYSIAKFACAAKYLESTKVMIDSGANVSIIRGPLTNYTRVYLAHLKDSRRQQSATSKAF